MDKMIALRLIKNLRDLINDTADCGPDAEMWENAVCEKLDQAGDLIEFPVKLPKE